jgi:hypothetical protein
MIAELLLAASTAQRTKLDVLLANRVHVLILLTATVNATARLICICHGIKHIVMLVKLLLLIALLALQIVLIVPRTVKHAKPHFLFKITDAQTVIANNPTALNADLTIIANNVVAIFIILQMVYACAAIRRYKDV